MTPESPLAGDLSDDLAGYLQQHQGDTTSDFYEVSEDDVRLAVNLLMQFRENPAAALKEMFEGVLADPKNHDGLLTMCEDMLVQIANAQGVEPDAGTKPRQ